MSATEQERNQFSARLRQALRNIHQPDNSPTALARQFNIRGETVTVHAARKWLVGEAIPTQPKIRQLANWLGVQADWLRFGDGDGASTPTDQLAPHSVAMLESFGRLSERDQSTVQSLINHLLQAPTARGPGRPSGIGK